MSSGKEAFWGLKRVSEKEKEIGIEEIIGWNPLTARVIDLRVHWVVLGNSEWIYCWQVPARGQLTEVASHGASEGVGGVVKVGGCLLALIVDKGASPLGGFILASMETRVALFGVGVAVIVGSGRGAVIRLVISVGFGVGESILGIGVGVLRKDIELGVGLVEWAGEVGLTE
jgi:hypothetical protein